MSGTSFTTVDAFAASTPFTTAQVVDIIRFCGYPAYTHFGWVFESDYATLLLRLQNMAAAEASVVTSNYLSALPTMEAAIDNSASNLDTDQAAVWTHNKNEVRDRTALYNQKRLALCDYIGVSPGRALRRGATVNRT